MKDETVVVIGYPGFWRKTKAHGLYSSNKLDPDRRLNAQKYVASCIFLLRYQEERTGMSLNWDAQFARVDNSLKTFTPSIFWRDRLDKLNRTAYRFLELALIEETSLKLAAATIDNSLSKLTNDRAAELHFHRRGKRLLIWALNEFHAMLTDESFYTIISHDPLRGRTSTRARGS